MSQREGAESIGDYIQKCKQTQPAYVPKTRFDDLYPAYVPKTRSDDQRDDVKQDLLVDSQAAQMFAILKSKATTLPENQTAEPDNSVITTEMINRFLDYVCGYRKHKGKQWREVLLTDYNYFCWLVSTRLDQNSLSYRVFSQLL